MRTLYCPQCGVNRFYVKQTDGKRLFFKVSADYHPIPFKPWEQGPPDITGALLFCAGCSWTGPVTQLKKVFYR